MLHRKKKFQSWKQESSTELVKLDVILSNFEGSFDSIFRP